MQTTTTAGAAAADHLSTMNQHLQRQKLKRGEQHVYPSANCPIAAADGDVHLLLLPSVLEVTVDVVVVVVVVVAD